MFKNMAVVQLTSYNSSNFFFFFFRKNFKKLPVIYESLSNSQPINKQEFQTKKQNSLQFKVQVEGQLTGQKVTDFGLNVQPFGLVILSEIEIEKIERHCMYSRENF